MKKTIILFSVFANTLVFASTIEWPIAIVYPFDGEVTLWVGSNLLPQPNYAHAAVFCYLTDMSSSEVTLSAWGVLLTPSSRWRQMYDGDEVNSSTMASSHKDFFATDSEPYYGEVTIGYGESIYLGFVIGPDYGHGYGYYGWVELGYDENGITAWGSGMDIDGAPILIGAIPEPSSALLALMGFAVLGLRRRRVLQNSL